MANSQGSEFVSGTHSSSRASSLKLLIVLTPVVLALKSGTVNERQKAKITSLLMV